MAGGRGGGYSATDDVELQFTVHALALAGGYVREGRAPRYAHTVLVAPTILRRENYSYVQ